MSQNEPLLEVETTQRCSDSSPTDVLIRGPPTIVPMTQHGGFTQHK